MLAGATTYKFFTEYLPELKEEADSFTDKISSLSKEEITKLKEQSGKDIVIWENMKLAHSLMKEGFIDEVQLRVIPATLGKANLYSLSHMIWNS